MFTDLNRRRFLQRLAGGSVLAAAAKRARADNADVVYGKKTIPAGIRSRFADGINGLKVHFLEAGFEARNRALLLLLHGYPELGYSWRKIMPPLAAAGYRVVAPDQRGFGQTTGWDPSYDADLSNFTTLQMVRDALSLVNALGYHSIPAVIGHDAGSPIAAWCAIVRPDVFKSVVMMSAPFGGTPTLPFNQPTLSIAQAQERVMTPAPPPSLDQQLAALPRPRKYYQDYYRTRQANDDMLHAPQGLHAFFRAYYYCKSADWKGNQPFPLKDRSGT